MTVTQSRIGTRQTIQENKETVFVDFSKMRWRQLTKESIRPKEEATGNVVSLISDYKKILFPLGDSFYHFWIDEVALIATYHNLDKSIQIVIDESTNAGSIESKISNFVIKLLDYHKVNYVKVNGKEIDGLLVNNLVDGPIDIRVRLNGSEDVFNFVKPFITNPNQMPYKKAFVSRTGIKDRTYPNVDPSKTDMPLPPELFNDNRINDHKKLEEFFETLGFEIIVPETRFKNFEEQLNYFYSVKTLASLTSSGITNAAFMRPGQTVIELVTPLLMLSGDRLYREDIHHFFSMISFNKTHTHVGIPNDERNADILIKRIQDNKKLMDFLKSEQ